MDGLEFDASDERVSLVFPSAAELPGHPPAAHSAAASAMDLDSVTRLSRAARHHSLSEIDDRRQSAQKKKSRIEVVVRKRPLNRKEETSGEADIVKVHTPQNHVRIIEPKVKVDLTKYTQKHDFVFDAAYNESASNVDIYERSVRPLLDTVFAEKGKATCFAYGQTGSGKTFTLLGCASLGVKGIYVLAVRDIYSLIGGKLRVMVSFYEIYGGKLFDLLAARQPLDCREDGKQKVNIVGLKRTLCNSEAEVFEVIAVGNAERQTGATGANAASSRSHAILQLDVISAKQRLHGRLSFVDLAGAERGADTFANSKETRREGSEINKSLLALKECIRALDQNHAHKPFRGSKLTQVLKESFMGNSRTVMIANISPNSGACENTLNTLRYADRVKELKAVLPSLTEHSRVDTYMPHQPMAARPLATANPKLTRNQSQPTISSRPHTSAGKTKTPQRTRAKKMRTVSRSVKKKKAASSHRMDEDNDVEMTAAGDRFAERKKQSECVERIQRVEIRRKSFAAPTKGRRMPLAKVGSSKRSRSRRKDECSDGSSLLVPPKAQSRRKAHSSFASRSPQPPPRIPKKSLSLLSQATAQNGDRVAGSGPSTARRSRDRGGRRDADPMSPPLSSRRYEHVSASRKHASDGRQSTGKRAPDKRAADKTREETLAYLRPKPRSAMAEGSAVDCASISDAKADGFEEVGDGVDASTSRIRRPRARTPKLSATEEEFGSAIGVPKDVATKRRPPHECQRVSQKQLIRFHRKHIDEFMLLIKDDMKLLKEFDKGVFAKEEYVQKLEDLLAKQAKSILSFQDKIQNS